MADSRNRIDMSLDAIIKLNRRKGGTSNRTRPGSFKGTGPNMNSRKPIGRKTNSTFVSNNQQRRGQQGRPIPGRNSRAVASNRNYRGRGRRQYGRSDVVENVGAGLKLFRNAFQVPENSRPQNRDMGSRKGASTPARGKRTLGSQQQTSAKKTTVCTTDGGQLKLFTKNFDARSKIEAKRSRKEGTEVTKATKKDELDAPGQKRRKLEDGKLKITTKQENRDRMSLMQGKGIKVTTLSEKFEESGVVHYPNRAASGPVVMCEYDEPTYKLERTIRPQPHFEEDSPVQQQRTSSRARVQQTETYTPAVSTMKRKQTPQIQKNTNKVVISNLHPNVTSEDIRELFGAVGDFVSATLLHPGMAEVIYEYPDDAILAYKKYHSRNLDGQPMICKLMSTESVTYQPSSSRSRDVAQSRPSSKPVVFTVKI